MSSVARRNTRPALRLLLAIDVAAVVLASIGGYVTRQVLGEAGVLNDFQNELPVAIGVLPMWLTVLWGFGCYRPQFLSQSSESLRRFLAASSVAGLILGFLSFLLRLDLSRLYVLVTYLGVVVLGTAGRAALRDHLRRRRLQGLLIRRVAIVGVDAEALDVARAMRGYPVAGYDVIGFLADDPPADTAALDGLPVLGRLDDVSAVCASKDVSLVVISPTAVAAGTLQELTLKLEDSDVDLAVAPSLFEVVTRRVTVESVNNVPLLHVDQIRLTGGKALVKRLFDLGVAGILGALSIPVVVAAAIAIKVEDGGPVLFRQERVGKDGQRFTLVKFRTMVVGAETRLDEVTELNEAGQHFFKVRSDPRVTRVGRVLRKWSIDEIPQFVNVLRGDMSLLGPRPPLPAEVARYESWHRRRLRIKPGISGVWQVSGRSDVPFDEAVRLDLFYIENWSLGYDLYLVARTVAAVLGRRGAY